MLTGAGIIEVLTGAGDLTGGDGLDDVKDETGLYLAWKSLIQSLDESEAVDEEGDWEELDFEDDKEMELDKSWFLFFKNLGFLSLMFGSLMAILVLCRHTPTSV